MSAAATDMRVAGLAGRVALVTGAARGIGRDIALGLAAQGARTVGADLVAPNLDGITPIVLDVTDENSVDTAFSHVEAELGPVEVLVLNAGIFAVEQTETMPLEAWRHMMAVNLDGSFLCARRALASMRERRFGRIVAIGSASGIIADPPQTAAYSASKAGLMNLMKSLARDYSGFGITANAVAPALIRTPMAGDALDALADLTRVGRVGETDDVAAAVVFLCSEHASYITGAVLDVNGGYLIH